MTIQKTKVKEKNIEEHILEHLNLFGMAWKNEYPGRFVRGQFVRASSKYVVEGMTDITFVRNGKIYFLEVKTPDEKELILRRFSFFLSYVGKNKDYLRYKRQILFIEALKKQGIPAGFVASLKESLDLIGST